MSEYERHQGNIKKVDTDLSIREFVNKIIEDNNIKVPDYYDLNNENHFNDFCNDKIFDLGYYFSENNIYKFDNVEKDDESDIFEFNKKDDGSIDYQFRFYNGGTCLIENIADVIEAIEN